MPHRRGFSLVELLTALVLLAVGLAAYARAAGAVARLDHDTQLRRAVAAVTTARLDSVVAEPCDGAPHSGVATFQGVQERWSTVPEGRRVRFADSTVVPSRPSIAHAIAATIACNP